MAHFHDNALIGASGQGGYQISRSLRFDSASTAYLSRTPASAGNRRTWTWSAWIKFSSISVSSNGIFEAATNSSNRSVLVITGNSQLQWFDSSGGSTVTQLVTSQVFRDFSAWYHIVVAVDTTQATSSNRVKIYVNGSQVTAFGTATYPSQNFDTQVNAAVATVLGAGTAYTPSAFYDGYLTDINFIDGQALTPSSFGETDTITGVWKPKKYAGTYGTNGFYLNFSDNSGTTSTTLGKDSSGNGNNWTPNNFSVTAGAGNDSLIDTPTPYADGGNGRGNYCTANPLNSNASTLRNGNLEFIGDTGSSYAKGILGTIAVSSGKWYFEVTPDSGGTFFIGVAPSTGSGIGNVDLEYINGAYSYRGNGDKVQGTGGSGTSSAYGNTYASPDVIGIALDLDNGAIYFAKNNTWQNSGVPTSGSSKTGAAFTSFSGSYVPMACGFNGATATLNFGQRPFEYTPPSGFVALNTQNLPEPSIKKPNQYFDATTYTSNGTTQTITNAGGFQPDLVWTKARSSISNHVLNDSVRGAANYLVPNATDAEASASTYLTSFNSNGYSIGAGNFFGNGTTVVGWQWKESATPGFDIVTYTGNGSANQVVNHSLGVTPNFVIIKARSLADNWNVFGSGFTRLILNQTTADLGNYPITRGASSITLPSISDSAWNSNGSTYVAYLWSEVAGFSKFGSYTGNGSSDGPFVFCGFRPRWVMIKSATAVFDWYIMDASRGTYNTIVNYLNPNRDLAELTDLGGFDILSNGFKVRQAGALNASSNTLIFAAFAEHPFKYALAR